LVYGATHRVTGKRVAIKISRDAVTQRELKRLIREARCLNGIGHPNVIDVHTFGALADGRTYLVSEWLQGQDLAQRMKQGPIPLTEAMEVLEQIVAALAVLHGRGIVHRDLKPANVFLVRLATGRPVVKLLDFGIAKLAAPSAGESTTRTKPIGTPSYASPEQTTGDPAGSESDIYSLGVLCYELLLGRRPFDGNAVTLAYRHATEPPPRPRSLRPGVVRDWERLLLAMLAKAPGERPTLEQVRRVMTEVPLPLRPAPPATLRWRSATVAIALASAIAGLALRPTPAPTRAAIPRVEPPNPIPALALDRETFAPPRDATPQVALARVRPARVATRHHAHAVRAPKPGLQARATATRSAIDPLAPVDPFAGER
jgi:serine/threonine-protein kinase